MHPSLPFLRVFAVVFGRPDRHALALLSPQLPLVVLLYLLAMLGLDAWGLQLPVFNAYGLLPQLGYLALLAAFTYLLAGSRHLTLPAAAVPALMLEWDAWCMVLAQAATVLMAALQPAWQAEPVAAVLLAWTPLAVLLLGWLRIFHAAWGARLWRSLATGVWAGLVLLAQLVLSSGWDGFWVEAADDRAAADEWSAYRTVNVEQVYYRQPALLQQALDGVAASRPGVPELYFVGFAGWAHQDVFWSELQFADRLLGERYGTAGRHVLLVNHLDTLAQWPLANRHNLERVLQGIGSRMGEEDILLLFLSSHGDEDEGVSTRFWPLSPNDIRPAPLKAMLDAAGIRRRVLVVSACYAGQFIVPLQDAHSVIATAAAADRTSFGCSHENDFTYYGQALFADGLAQGETLEQALQAAIGRIAAREAAEGKELSQPQLWQGEAMAGVLAQLEAAVAAQAVPKP